MSEFIDQLLDETKLHDDLALRELLGDLEREATAITPIPSVALSELMPPRRAGSRRATRRPSLASRGVIITGVVVIGVLGFAAGAAAASLEARSIGAGVSAVAHLFEPESAAKPPASTDRSIHAPAIGSSHQRPEAGTTFDGASEADHASSHQRDGSQNAGDPNTQLGATGSGSTGSGSSGSTGSGSSGSTGSSSSESGSSGHSDDSNSGNTHGGDSGGESGHGGSGNDNGGPAPTR